MGARVLTRATDLAGFRRAVRRLAVEGGVADIRRRGVIVPTRAAAELLRQVIERGLADGGATQVLPDIVTRDEWLSRWAAALPVLPRLASRLERETILRAAAEATAARPRMGGSPFRLRPALIGAMLDFYDELRRRQRGVGRLRRAVIADLKGERGFDRGSDALIHQTAFLVLAYLRYERMLDAAGLVDEHGCRAWFLDQASALPHQHVVIAVADSPTDPRGLWPADFDLLGRLSHLRIDVVVTDELHDAGFRERLERELPGIEEAREPGRPWTPVIVRPVAQPDVHDRWHWLSHDREDELRDVARMIRARAAGATPAPTALVVQRPLPYEYLVEQILSAAGVPWQSLETRPLAGEPFAAALDLVLTAARTGGTDDACEALARSPWFSPAMPQAAVMDALAPFRDAGRASDQVGAVASFLRRYGADDPADAPWRDAAVRARAAVLAVLDGVVDACRRHDDRRRDPDELVALVRHFLEQKTFALERRDGPVVVVDAVSARFGEFDHVHLLGVVETDWPERPRRSIFYTAGLLKALGWPQDADHAAAQLAAFRDLAGLPARTLHAHAFELDADAVVGLSPVLELLRGMPDQPAAPVPPTRVFDDEVLGGGPWPEADGDVLPTGARGWYRTRRARRPLTDAAFRGQADPQPARQYKVTGVEEYVTCPFKYFASSVLRLPDEREAEALLTPLERGTLMHDIFERFYREWQAAGHGAITMALLPDALDRFAGVAADRLAALPEADRVLEETRLLGSLVARGVAERVFELEVDTDEPIESRWLEVPLKGVFRFPRRAGLEQVEIRISGKADRIDVLAGGRLRVVDYKLGRMPDPSVSLQVGVYAHAARQWLEAQDGGAHPVVSALYLAFGSDYRVDGPLAKGAEETAAAVEARAARFADVVERIEAGEFPARPRDVSECAWCRHAGVCRKEYDWGDDAAEPV